METKKASCMGWARICCCIVMCHRLIEKVGSTVERLGQSPIQSFQTLHRQRWKPKPSGTHACLYASTNQLPPAIGPCLLRPSDATALSSRAHIIRVNEQIQFFPAANQWCFPQKEVRLFSRLVRLGGSRSDYWLRILKRTDSGHTLRLKV
jgi:hypothetical protein